MAIDYNKSRATATRLIRENGSSVTLRRYIPSGDEWNPVQIPSDAVVSALMTNYKADEIDGTLIHASDKKFLVVAGADVTLAKRLIHDGADYEIVSAQAVKPASVLIMWKVQARL